MSKIKDEAFLSRSVHKAWDSYIASISDDGFPRWDYVIITASNERQAIGFKAQLAVRAETGFLPKRTHFGVVPDPVGERVGNGGAMLGAMRYVAEASGRTNFKGLKILVILSSGDSKRVPQYSALGKVFSPVPRELPNGRLSTLFDEIMMAVSGIPRGLEEGMLVLSGDVLLVFDADQIVYSDDEAMAITFPEPVETGANHGVFLSDERGYISKVWHKQSEETLKSYGAVDDDGYVNIDTGAVIFTPPMLSSLFRLICNENGECDDVSFRKYVNGHIAPSLYVDFFYPLAIESTFEGYMREIPEGVMSRELLDARTAIWNALRPYRIKLVRLSPARFIHFGTTADVMKLMSTGIEAYEYLGWRKQIGSAIDDKKVAGYNSILSPEAKTGESVYLENACIHGGCAIGDNCIISGIELYDETIPPNVVLHGLKQTNGKYVARIYGIDDNPKATLEEGARLFGRPLATFLSMNGIDEAALWPKGTSRSLWTANLYPECSTIREAVSVALNLYQMAQGCGDSSIWRESPRKSLHSSFDDADGNAVMIPRRAFS